MEEDNDADAGLEDFAKSLAKEDIFKYVPRSPAGGSSTLLPQTPALHDQSESEGVTAADLARCNKHVSLPLDQKMAEGKLDAELLNRMNPEGPGVSPPLHHR